MLFFLVYLEMKTNTVIVLCPLCQCFMSPLKLTFQWQENFCFPWEESAALGSQGKLENTTPTNPNIRKQKSAQNENASKTLVCLLLEGTAADLCNHLSCRGLSADFEAEWALSSFANWRDLLWSDPRSVSNPTWNILLWGSFFLGLFFWNCAAVNWKWKQDSEGLWAWFAEGGKGRSVPPCSLVSLVLPVRHSRGGRWQGHVSLSSCSVQGINVHLSLPDRCHHPLATSIPSVNWNLFTRENVGSDLLPVPALGMVLPRELGNLNATRTSPEPSFHSFSV